MLEKYELIWNKISSFIEKEFDKKPVFYGKYLNSKLNPKQIKIKTNFCGKKRNPKNNLIAFDW